MPAQNILALVLLLAVAVAVIQHARAVSNITPAEPEQPRETVPALTCHVRGCGRLAYWQVKRHDTGEWKPVCTGCKDEGTAWGWWA